MPTILDPEDGVSTNAERFTSMSLTRNVDAVIRDSRHQMGTRAVNRVDDISGARPRSLPPHQRLNFHDNGDIDGARPRTLHRERRETADVRDMTAVLPGSFSSVSGFEARTRRRDVNPLEPVYHLPSLPAVAIPTLPFKRDLHNIDDIAGTKPVVFKPYATRDSHNVHDIAGTTSVPRTFQRDMNLDSMTVRDINVEGIFKSARRTDPLRPEHTVHGRVVSDDDPAMYIKPRTRTVNRPFLSLTTADIEGAQTHFQQEVPVGGIAPEDRRQYRVTNYVSDIKGALANSAKRGLDSGRATNPLERDYIMLDGRHLTAEELAVGKSWYNAAATVLAAETAEAEASMPIGKTGVSAGVGPAMTYAKKILDPRDAELASLRGAVHTLRKEREVMALTATLGRTQAQGQGSTALIGRGAASEGGAGALHYRGSSVQHPSTSSFEASPGFNAPRSAAGGTGARVATANAAEAAPQSQSAGSVAELGDDGGISSAEDRHGSARAANTPRAAAREFDPVASLRATVAAANARNIIGVIPTYPSAQAQAPMGGSGALGGTGVMRASGKFDSNLDKDAPVTRGENKFSKAPPSLQVVPLQKTNFQMSQQRTVARERASEVADVRGLPDLKVR